MIVALHSDEALTSSELPLVENPDISKVGIEEWSK
jgi:hypothetical protein